MRLLSITAENFRQHRSTHVELPLGIIGFTGPNEVGKSTLGVEAPLWALFGGVAVRGTKAGLLSHTAGPGAKVRVVLVFEMDGARYEIERTEANATLRCDDKVIAQGTSPVNNKVPELLGMSYEQFVTSHAIRQKDMDRLRSMLPTERQAFIRQVMGVGRIDDGLKACRKTKARLAEEIRGMESMLGPREPLAAEVANAEHTLEAAASVVTAAQAQVADTKLAHEQSTERLNASSKDRAAHEQLVTCRDAAAKDVSAAKDELARLRDERKAQAAARDRLEAEEPKLAALPEMRKRLTALHEAKAYRSEKKLLTERIDTLAAEIADAEDALGRCQQQAAGHDPTIETGLVAEVAGLVRQLEELQDARRDKRAEAVAQEKAHRRSATKAEAARRTLEDIGADAPCPTCTRPLGAALDDMLADMLAEAGRYTNLAVESRLAAEALEDPSDDEVEVQVALDEVRSRLEAAQLAGRVAVEAEAKVREHTATLEKLGVEKSRAHARLKKLPHAEYDAAEARTLADAIDSLETLDRSLTECRTDAGRLAHTLAELKRWEGKHDTANGLLKTAQRDLDELAFDAATHKVLSTENEKHATAYHAADKRLAQATADHAAATTARDRARELLAEHDEKAVRLAAVRDEHLLHERVDGRLSAFRVAVAGTIRPEMEELVSGYVNLLTDGKHESVEIGEDFSVTLYEDGMPCEVVSGGTEDVEAMAMRLAISHMISERAGQRVGMLILDEPFGSLDEVRRASFVNLIRLVSGAFPQVITMSHVAETREMVDHVVALEHDAMKGAVVRCIAEGTDG